MRSDRTRSLSTKHVVTQRMVRCRNERGFRGETKDASASVARVDARPPATGSEIMPPDGGAPPAAIRPAKVSRKRGWRTSPIGELNRARRTAGVDVDRTFADRLNLGPESGPTAGTCLSVLGASPRGTAGSAWYRITGRDQARLCLVHG